MVAVRTHLATYADLEALGDDGRAEIIAGVLVYKAMPSMRHGHAQGSVITTVKPPFERGRGGPGGWWFGTEVTVEFDAHDVFVPDVAGWRRERLPELPPVDEAVLRVRPDWVCEILSPSNARNDLGVKLDAYFRYEVPHYWILDPKEKTLTVFRRGGDGYDSVPTASNNDVVRAEPFEAIELHVAELFGG